MYFASDGLRSRTIEIFGRNLLAGVGIQIFQIGFGNFAGAMPIDVTSTTATGGSARMLLGGIHDLEFVRAEFFDREIRFVFPRQQNVAQTALHERGGRAARARIEHRHVAIERGDEFARLLFVVADLFQA